jgi:hypothetical protein
VRALAVVSLLMGGCTAGASPFDDGCTRVAPAPRTLAFSDPQVVTLDESIVSIAAADFDGDRKSDVVVLTDSSLRVLGTRGGLFTPVFVAPLSGAQVVAADLDGDGRADVLVVDPVGDVLSFRGRGDGTLETAQSVRSFAPPTRVAAADLDGDGRAELFAATLDPVEQFHDATDGAALAATLPATGAFTARDATGDGLTDLLATDGLPGGGIELLAGVAGAGFAMTTSTLSNGGAAIGALDVCDFDGDGMPDFAAGTPSQSPRLIKPAAPTLPLPSHTTGIAAGDFDGDGLPDLAAAGDNQLVVYLNRP